MTLPPDIHAEKPGRKRLLLILKLVLAGAAVFVAGELSWRFTGLQPEHSDLLDFDRFYRAAVDLPNAVAMIGSSRVLSDLDPGILNRELPKWEFYQLAVEGASPLPMLENLALNARFRGHVLCEYNTGQFVAQYPFRENEFHQVQYAQFTQRRPYIDFLKTWFFETLRQHSALVTADDQGVDFFLPLRASLASIIRHRRAPGSVSPPVAVRRDDRFVGLHRRGRDNSHALALWAQLAGSRENGDANLLQRVALWVETIRRRGGDVIFIRMPVSGSLKRIEDKTYPERDRVMQALAGSGIDIIDSAREPALSGFECSDESHLDADDAGRFSTALGRILADRQLLTRAASYPPINRE